MNADQEFGICKNCSLPVDDMSTRIQPYPNDDAWFCSLLCQQRFEEREADIWKNVVMCAMCKQPVAEAMSLAHPDKNVKVGFCGRGCRAWYDVLQDLKVKHNQIKQRKGNDSMIETRIAHFSTVADIAGAGFSLRDFTVRVTLKGYSNNQNIVRIHDRYTDEIITTLTRMIRFADQDWNEVFISENAENAQFITYLRNRFTLFRNTNQKLLTTNGDLERWVFTGEKDSSAFWKRLVTPSNLMKQEPASTGLSPFATALKAAQVRNEILNRKDKRIAELLNQVSTLQRQIEGLNDQISQKDKSVDLLKGIAHRRFTEKMALEKTVDDLKAKLAKVFEVLTEK